MSLGIYPKRIPVFPVHRDLLDDVEAEHINNIQRELTSVADILGIEPQIYNDKTVPQVTGLTEVPGDTGGVDPDTATYAGDPRYFNPNSERVDYGTISRRLDSIERGLHNHSFTLTATTFPLSRSANMTLEQRPKGIRFPKPSAKNDPFNMFNGIGVRIRKSGFWVIRGSVVINRNGTNANNQGLFQAVIDRNENWIDGMDRQEWDANQATLSLCPLISGYFQRGDKITLRVSHNSNHTQQIRLARLSGWIVREDVD